MALQLAEPDRSILHGLLQNLACIGRGHIRARKPPQVPSGILRLQFSELVSERQSREQHCVCETCPIQMRGVGLQRPFRMVMAIDDGATPFTGSRLRAHS